MNTLIYVDAENVTREDVEKIVTLTKEKCYNKHNIVGKFYGAKTSLGAKISSFLQLGLEYIETSVLSINKKNVADMKILTDVLYDTLVTYNGSVNEIVLLTSDNDFMPLIHKLSSMNIPVETPLFNVSATLDDLIKELTTQLKDVGYLPMSITNLTKTHFGFIKSVVDSSVDDNTISAFLEQRIKKLYFGFLRSDCAVYKEKAKQILAVPVQDFSIYRVLNIFNFSDYEDNFALINFYANKMFGISVKERDALEILNDKSKINVAC